MFKDSPRQQHCFFPSELPTECHTHSTTYVEITDWTINNSQTTFNNTPRYLQNITHLLTIEHCFPVFERPEKFAKLVLLCNKQLTTETTNRVSHCFCYQNHGHCNQNQICPNYTLHREMQWGMRDMANLMCFFHDDFVKQCCITMFLSMKIWT